MADETTETAVQSNDNWLQIDATPTEADPADTAETDEAEADDQTEENAADTAPEDEPADQPEQEEGEADADDAAKGADEQTDQFTLKHLDETKTVSREEVVQLAQKGMDYDRIRQKYDEQTGSLNALKSENDAVSAKVKFMEDFAVKNGYRNMDEMFDSVTAAQIAEQTGVTQEVALKQVRLDRREQELAAKEAKLSQEKTAQTSAAEQQAAAEAKKNADFAEFANSEYGKLDASKIPQDVWDTYAAGGCTLVQAMMQYENAQLKVKLAAQQKNAENKQRSAGSRRSAGAGQKKDPWDEAWAANP